MNRYFSLITFILALAMLMSCEEEGPYINFIPDIVDTSLLDTTYIAVTPVNPLPKKVLLDEFTGVRCPNCPDAAKKIHEIDSIYPGRLIPLAIHMFNNNFAHPHIPSIDYRTTEGTNLFELLGKGSLPIGAIDRVKFDSETNTLVRLDKWVTYFVDRLSTTPYCNIYLSTRPHATEDKTQIISVKVHYTKATTEVNFISLAVVESGLISPQTQPNGKVDSNYIHNHVLRKIITNYNGNILSEGAEINRVYEKEFKLKLSESWKADRLSIIAYIHLNDTKYNVVQVEKINL